MISILSEAKNWYIDVTFKVICLLRCSVFLHLSNLVKMQSKFHSYLPSCLVNESKITLESRIQLKPFPQP